MFHVKHFGRNLQKKLLFHGVFFVRANSGIEGRNQEQD